VTALWLGCCCLLWRTRQLPGQEAPLWGLQCFVWQHAPSVCAIPASWRPGSQCASALYYSMKQQRNPARSAALCGCLQ
jgi:hypothetical protein